MCMSLSRPLVGLTSPGSDPSISGVSPADGGRSERRCRVRKLGPFLGAALLSFLVLGAGCAVPPSKFRRDAGEINAKANEMQQAFNDEKWESALSKAEEITRLGDALAAKILIGDPLRKTVDDALAQAREVREEAQQQEAGQTTDKRQRLDAMAKRALEAAAANKKAPRPPPPGAESVNLLAGVSGITSTPAPAAVAVAIDTGAPRLRNAGGEVDLDRHASIVEGDREGDISDDEIVARVRRGRRAKELAPDKAKINENSPPVTVTQMPITKGKAVAAYFTVINNTDDPKYVVSVSADFIRETGAKSGYANAVFRVKGFVPKWKDIIGSEGETLTGDGFAIEPMSALQLVAVGWKPKVGKIEKVKLAVCMRGGKMHRFTGPKEPDPDEDKD